MRGKLLSDNAATGVPSPTITFTLPTFLSFSRTPLLPPLTATVSPPGIVIGTHVELRFINDNVEVWLMGVDYETVQHVVVVVEVSKATVAGQDS